MSVKNDPIGACLKDYLAGDEAARILTWSDLEGWDYLPASKLFRGYADMPEIEQKALYHCKGKVLDIGAGAGSHTQWLVQNGLDTLAIDVSAGAVEVMNQRGIDALQADVFQIEETGYDTLLMMMNGIGLCGDKKGFFKFMEKAENLLEDKGQLLFDSADIIYMFEEEGAVVDLKKEYYGEVIYRMKYQEHTTSPFGWLFLDFDTLRNWCTQIGWSVKRLYEGDNYEYLARVVRT